MSSKEYRDVVKDTAILRDAWGQVLQVGDVVCYARCVGNKPQLEKRVVTGLKKVRDFLGLYKDDFVQLDNSTGRVKPDNVLKVGVVRPDWWNEKEDEGC